MMRRLLRWFGTAMLWGAIALTLLIVIVPPFLDRIYYQGPVTVNFDGERFVNPDDGQGEWEPAPFDENRRSRSSSFMWRMIMGDNRPGWPDHVAVEQTVPEDRVEGARMVVTWVGHATTLVQTQGLNILTDPIWSDYATPYPPIGPRRVSEPGIAFDDLPRIDLILVSHNHYDHMDIPTLRRLWDRDQPMIVTSLGNDSVIEQSGAQSIALDWGEAVDVTDAVSVVVTRNHHWGSRWGVDRNRALWSSFTIRTPGGNVFFAGDTGPGDMRWPAEAASYGPVRLALIPIGAFRFQEGQNWSSNHIGPDHAVQVLEELDAAHALAIHWATFRLSFEGYNVPRDLLNEHLADAGVSEDRFRAVPIGTSWDVPEL